MEIPEGSCTEKKLQTGAPVWRKSSKSVNDGSCVEIASLCGSILVRDSRKSASVYCQFDAPAWKYFIEHIKHARLNLCFFCAARSILLASLPLSQR